MERRRWPMNPFVFGMKGPEHAWLAPELHELLRLAQQEAASRGMAEISVEHFLLGALVYNDARTMRLFVALGLDPKALRSSILDRIGPLDAPIEDDVRAVPFSLELQLCVDQAVAATHACDITFVHPSTCCSASSAASGSCCPTNFWIFWAQAMNGGHCYQYVWNWRSRSGASCSTSRILSIF